MDKPEFEKLDYIVKRGKWRFVVFHGVLGWGIVTAVLISLSQYFTGTAHITQAVMINLVLFPIGGASWGLYKWPFLTKEHAEQISKKL